MHDGPIRLDASDTAVLVVDVQEKLTPVMAEADALVGQVGRLLDGAAVLDLPVIATEQYPRGLGGTVASLADRLGGARRFEKMKFSSCVEPVRDELVRLERRCVLVAGIEAHVCVLHTCLDLLEAGYRPVVVCDAIASRRLMDREVATQRMVQAGVVPTTVESALMEMVDEAGTPRFKAMLAVIK